MAGFHNVAALVLLAGLLSGCDSAPINGLLNKPGGQSEIRAGRWQMTATTRSFALPQASADQAQRYQSAIGQRHSQSHCLSAAEAQLGPMAMAEGFKQGDCSVTRFDASNGSINGQLTCRIAGGGSADMQIGGHYTPDSIVMVLTNDLHQPSLPGGEARMIMDVTGSRLGDCAA